MNYSNNTKQASIPSWIMGIIIRPSSETPLNKSHPHTYKPTVQTPHSTNNHLKPTTLLPPILLPASLTLTTGAPAAAAPPPLPRIVAPGPDAAAPAAPVPPAATGPLAPCPSPFTSASSPRSRQTASCLRSMARVIPNAACWSGTTSSSSSGFGGWY